MDYNERSIFFINDSIVYQSVHSHSTSPCEGTTVQSQSKAIPAHSQPSQFTTSGSRSTANIITADLLGATGLPQQVLLPFSLHFLS